MYKFNAKELDESTGYSYYGARYYDPAISIFLSVDPLAEQFVGWNPYTYTFNNPINFIDPDGRSGEPVIDMKNKTLTIFSKLYFYGSKAESKLSEKIATGIASQWNGAKATTTIDGVNYDVKFRISYETITEDKAKTLAQDNKSLRNNFVRVEDGQEGQSSFTLASKQGGNSFWFNTDDELGTSTTAAHEYGHGLGLKHPEGDLSKSEERPNIMIPRQTPYGKNWSKKDENGRQVINPNSRRVTPNNVLEGLKNKGGKVHNRIINKNGTY